MNSEYILPFDTDANSVQISQGRNGPWSHFVHPNGQDSINAVDFELPFGTSILAARDGIVVGIIGESDLVYSGTDPKIGLGLPPGSTNLVAIQHKDQTIAYYIHLEMRSACVTQGQKVKQGDEIGLTGRSGWIGPHPHLHFQVNQRDSRESLPVIFENYDGPLEHNEIFPHSEGENTRI